MQFVVFLSTKKRRRGCVSILPKFYLQHFCTKVFLQLFSTDSLGLKYFWQNNFGAKSAHKMLVRLFVDRKLAQKVLIKCG